MTGALHAFSAAQQKPTVISYGNTYWKEPPPTLREMASGVDTVVYGRVLDATVKAVDFYHPSEPGIVTAHRLKINEILPRPIVPVDPYEITVIQDGGTIDKGNRIEQREIANFPQLASGQEYVLFLQWHPEHRA